MSVREVYPPPPGASGPVPLLPARARRALPAITLATIIWVGGLGAWVAGRTWTVGPDGPIDRWVSSFDDHLNTEAQAVAGMARLSHFTILVVVILVACAALRATKAAFVFLGGVAVTLVAVEVIKQLVRRRMIMPTFQVVAGYTFPSGHVAVAAVIATVAILVCRRNGPAGRYLSRDWRIVVDVIAALTVVAVAASMLLIRDHYFIDTIAAAPLGVTATLLVAALTDAWTKRYPSRWWR